MLITDRPAATALSPDHLRRLRSIFHQAWRETAEARTTDSIGRSTASPDSCTMRSDIAMLV